MPSPSVGRWVHYVMPSGRHRPACIVEVNKKVVAALKEEMPETTVNLQVLTDCTNDSFQLGDKYSPDFKLAINSGMFWAINVSFDPVNMSIGSWHWQEYVE